MRNLNYTSGTSPTQETSGACRNRLGLIATLCMLGLMMLFAPQLRASHAMGGEITYTWVSGNQYHLKHVFYRDCAGVAAPTSANILVQGGTTSFSVNLPRTSLIDITPLCPGQVSRCTSSAGAYGVQEAVFQTTNPVTLNPLLSGQFYTLSFNICCRNAAITTIVNASSQTSHFEATLNPNVTPGNSSPVFLNRPVAYLCANQPAVLSPNAFDPDGDAIQYSLTPCRSNATTNLPYVAGFSSTNPITSSTGVTLNPSTGELSFTPTTVNQVTVVCVKAEEFRNGTKVGQVIRDIQIRVLNCNNAPPVIAPISNVVVPVGTNYCVNVNATDANNNNITLTAVSGIIPPATFTVTSSGAGFANGVFCFTPTAIHEGNTFSVTINAQDNGCPAPATGVETFNITVPAVCRVTATATSTAASCGQSNGTATATMTGGVAPYQYTWTGPTGFPGGFNSSISGLAAGTYGVTIVDGNSCVATATVVVGSAGGSFSASSTVTNANCGQSNGSISVSVSGGNAPYSYSLNGGPAQSSNVFSGLGLGNYTIAVTDASGCTGSTSANISVAPDVTNPSISCPSNISVSNDAGQCGAVVSFSVSASDDCGFVSTAQTSGGASGSQFGIGSSTVSFTAVDASGNTASCSFTVNVSDNENPSITCPANISVNNDAGQCGAVVSFSASATDNCAGVSTAQTSGGASGSLFAVGSSSVSFVATDASGNTANCSFSVTVADNEAPSAVCVNHTVNISSGGSASITNLDGGSSDNCGIASMTSGPLNYTCDDLGVNSYNFTVVDVNGNSSSATCTVTVTNDALSVSLSAGTYNCGYNVSCNGASDGSISSSVSGGCAPYSYSWNGNGGGAGLSGASAGAYTLVVTDGNGNSASASITLSQPDAVALSLSGSDVLCNGGSDGSASASVSGGCAPYSYAWSNGANGSNNGGLSAGSYGVTVTDANGCSASGSYTVSEPTALTVTAGANQSVYYGYGNNCVTLTQTTTGGTPGYTGVWTDGNNNVVGTSVCPSTTTTYCYTATDANGCTASACMTVCVLDIRCVGTSNNGNNGGNSGGQGGQGWMNGNAPQHVTVCHTPPGQPGTSWIMCLPPSAVPSHLAHGDYLGACGVGGPNFNCNTGNNKQGESNDAVQAGLVMQAFPNPTTGRINVELTSEVGQSGSIEIKVVDALGKVVDQKQVTLAGGRAMSEFNLSNQANGFYFIMATDGETRLTEKVMKN